MGRRLLRAIFVASFATTIALIVGGSTAGASNVVTGLSGPSDDTTVPTWLYLATGGGVVGAMALFSMLITDNASITAYHRNRFRFVTHNLRRFGGSVLGILGISALALVLIVGVVGPRLGQVSAAVLITFVGVRALLTMVAYTVGNPWPALNPWRRLAEMFPNGYRSYPSRLGTWPAVIALLVFVWLEIVAPLSSNPAVLALVIASYTVITVLGGVIFSPRVWFDRADPISVWFRFYGSVAPIQRTENGIDVRFPGARLGDADVIRDSSGIAFVILLVWELTFTGFIVTPAGHRTIEGLVALGISPMLVYFGLLLGGFIACYRIYWFAADMTRRQANTYLSRRYLAIRFAPPLIGIAAGYHVAHYIGFSISMWPSFVEVLSSPFDPPANPVVYTLPSWFGYVEIAGVLVGHIVGVWLAHTIAFELFDRKIQAIKSEFPFVLVMIAFTMLSLWLISLPASPAPFAG